MALAFPLNSELHIPFSKAILELNARGVVQGILRSDAFTMYKNECAWTSVGGGLSINFAEMGGLFIITFGGIFLAMLIGAVERFLYFRALAAKEEEEEEQEVAHCVTCFLSSFACFCVSSSCVPSSNSFVFQALIP